MLLKNDSSAVSFIYLELRKEGKDYRKAGESNVVIGLQYNWQNYVTWRVVILSRGLKKRHFQGVST